MHVCVASGELLRRKQDRGRERECARGREEGREGGREGQRERERTEREERENGIRVWRVCVCMCTPKIHTPT